MFVIFKKIKAGVDSDFPLAGPDGRVQTLGEMSRIPTDLEKDSLFFQPFFVFVYAKDEDLEDEIPKLLPKFGDLLWQHFEKRFDHFRIKKKIRW